MNKVYKIIWSKAKNCYVVVSELAKSHTKAPKSGVMSCALVVGILASVLSFSVVFPVLASEAPHQPAYNERVYNWASNGSDGVVFKVDANDNIIGIGIYADSENVWGDTVLEMRPIGSGGSGTLTGAQVISALGYTPVATDTNTTYSAGNGLVLAGTTFSVKAGTGITVDGNGVSITPGSVVSGNANAITGGTAYSELRPANGTFVKSNQTTATNLTALDTASKNAIKGLSANGNIITYTKGDGTTGTISTSAKYVGINSSGGTNQLGEGAIICN